MQFGYPANRLDWKDQLKVNPLLLCVFQNRVLSPSAPAMMFQLRQLQPLAARGRCVFSLCSWAGAQLLVFASSFRGERDVQAGLAFASDKKSDTPSEPPCSF